MAESTKLHLELDKTLAQLQSSQSTGTTMHAELHTLRLEHSHLSRSLKVSACAQWVPAVLPLRRRECLYAQRRPTLACCMLVL